MAKQVGDTDYTNLEALCPDRGPPSGEDLQGHSIGEVALKALQNWQQKHEKPLSTYEIKPLEAALEQKAVTGIWYYLARLVEPLAQFIFGKGYSLGVQEADALALLKKELGKEKEVRAALKELSPQSVFNDAVTLESIPEELEVDVDPLLFNLSYDGLYLDGAILEEANKSIEEGDEAKMLLFLPNLSRFLTNQGGKDLEEAFDVFRNAVADLSPAEIKEQWQGLYSKLESLVEAQEPREKVIKSYTRQQFSQLAKDLTRSFAITLDGKTYSRESLEENAQEVLTSPEEKRKYANKLQEFLEEIIAEQKERGVPENFPEGGFLAERWLAIRGHVPDVEQKAGDLYLEGVKVLNQDSGAAHRAEDPQSPGVEKDPTGLAAIVLLKIVDQLKSTEGMSEVEKQARFYSSVHQGAIGAVTSMLNGLGVRLISKPAGVEVTKQGKVSLKIEELPLSSGYIQFLLSDGWQYSSLQSLLTDEDYSLVSRGLESSKDLEEGGIASIGTVDLNISIDAFSTGLKVACTNKRANTNFRKVEGLSQLPETPKFASIRALAQRAWETLSNSVASLAARFGPISQEGLERVRLENLQKVLDQKMPEQMLNVFLSPGDITEGLSVKENYFSLFLVLEHIDCPPEALDMINSALEEGRDKWAFFVLQQVRTYFENVNEQDAAGELESFLKGFWTLSKEQRLEKLQEVSPTLCEARNNHPIDWNSCAAKEIHAVFADYHRGGWSMFFDGKELSSDTLEARLAGLSAADKEGLKNEVDRIKESLGQEATGSIEVLLDNDFKEMIVWQALVDIANQVEPPEEMSLGEKIVRIFCQTHQGHAASILANARILGVLSQQSKGFTAKVKIEKTGEISFTAKGANLASLYVLSLLSSGLNDQEIAQYLSDGEKVAIGEMFDPQKAALGTYTMHSKANAFHGGMEVSCQLKEANEHFMRS